MYEFFVYVLKVKRNVYVKVHGLQQVFNEMRAANPMMLQQLRQTDPQLVEAIERNDISRKEFLFYKRNQH
jgi:hypothetical protein